MAAVPAGLKGYIDVPKNTAKTSQHRLIDLNTVILTTVPKFPLNFTEPNVFRYQEKTLSDKIFEPYKLNLNKLPRSPLNSVCDVQESARMGPRHFPALSCSKENPHLLKETNFTSLTSMNPKTYNSVTFSRNGCSSATHCFDVGKISTSFRISLNPNANVQTQGPY